MLILVLSIILLGIIAFISGVRRHRKLREQLLKGEIKEMPEIHQVTDCGADECSLETTGYCSQDCHRPHLKEEVDYYDDEELDRFRGMEADAYTDEDVEAFREVLYTMLPTDVEGWTQSLQQRCIQMPSAIRDEVIMILEEQRTQTS